MGVGSRDGNFWGWVLFSIDIYIVLKLSVLMVHWFLTDRKSVSLSGF